MAETVELLTDKCWCCTAKKMVVIRGEIVGRRQAELLLIKSCDETLCAQRHGEHCMVNQIREGLWRRG